METRETNSIEAKTDLEVTSRIGRTEVLLGVWLARMAILEMALFSEVHCQEETLQTKAPT